MNILQILPELNVGGVGVETLELAGYLVRRGHKSVVVSSGGTLVEKLERAGSKHYALSMHKKSPLSIIWVIPKLIRIIRQEDIEIVHARSRGSAWSAFFASFLTNRVFITTCHAYYSNHFASRVIGWAKYVICPSQIIANHMNRNFKIPVQRLRLVQRGVDLDKFEFIAPQKKIADIFKIGIIGRLSRIKGHICLLQALVRVKLRIRNFPFKLWIIGDASAGNQDYKQELITLVKKFGLSDNVEFLGTRQDIPALLAELNLLVFASVRHEASARPIIEAQAGGVPVIATRVGGVIDIVDDNLTGILVSPSDAEELAQAIIRLMQDKTLAGNLAANARKKVNRNFTLDKMAKSTIGVYKEALAQRRILVIKLSPLEDIVLISVILRAIRKKFPAPDYKISLLINKPFQELMFNCPYIDELIVSEADSTDKGIMHMLRLSQELRRKNFDISIDFQNNHKSQLLAFFAAISLRYGFKRKFWFLLNRVIPCEAVNEAPLKQQSRLIEELGIDTQDYSLELWPGKEDEEFTERFLSGHWVAKNQLLVGINVSAGRRWQTKAWPQSYILRLCEELALRDIRVVFTGAPEDSAAMSEIMDLLKKAKPIIACGRTSLNQLVSLIKRCGVFISPDSAPLHIAASTRVPYIGLFGPTDPQRYPAFGRYKGIVLYKNISCSPCYKKACKSKACMYAITPQEVLQALEKLLV